MNYSLLDFDIHGNHEGCLVALEQDVNIPFDIKRIYYIWGTTKDTVRGKHSHYALEQIIVCMSGSCDFILDDGQTREQLRLDNPAQGLYIKHNIWREFTNFSPDCVLMVIASHLYDEADYIRDYDQFIKEVRA